MGYWCWRKWFLGFNFLKGKGGFLCLCFCKCKRNARRGCDDFWCCVCIVTVTLTIWFVGVLSVCLLLVDWRSRLLDRVDFYHDCWVGLYLGITIFVFMVFYLYVFDLWQFVFHPICYCMLLWHSTITSPFISCF